MLLQPGLDFRDVAAAVFPLEDPVPLVREGQEPRAHALALENLEGRDALVQRDAEIELSLRDERRRLPVRGIAERALVHPLALRLPHRPAHPPLAADAAVVDAVL